MKNLNFYIKKFLFLTLLILSFSSTAYAVELANDTFSNNSADGYSRDDGWTNLLKINRDRTSFKEYALGSSYANANVQVTFTMRWKGGWDDSGGSQDYFKVLFNDVEVVNDQFDGDVSDSGNSPKNYTLSATTDSSGNLKIAFNPDTTTNAEFAVIDNVIITSIPPNICTGTHGLRGNYYNDPSNNQNFIPPVILSRIDNDINFEWDGGSPDASINQENFSIEWTGTIYFPENADYIFDLAHDDTMELVIDGTTVYDETSWTNGVDNYGHTTPTHFDAGTYPITIKFVEWGGGAYAKLAWHNNASITSTQIIPTDNLCILSTGGTPPVVVGVPNRSVEVDTTFTPLDISDFTTESDGDSIVYSASGLPLGLSIDGTTGVISGTPTVTGTYTVSAIATDVDGADNDVFTITVTDSTLTVIANDDVYTILKNTILTTNLFTNDIGNPLQLNANSSASNGTVSITSLGVLTYTPDLDFFGTDSFTYSITDGSTVSLDANVTITVTNDTNYTDGFTDFHLVNPPSTRNVNGNFATAGNTVLCLTERTDSYGGTCKDAGASLDTSNSYIAKFIDIDENLGEGSGTWNSSSSNITLPDTYVQNSGRGILWAGLYWQGRISADDEHPMHYGMEDGSGGYTFIEKGEDGNNDDPDMTSVDANKLKLKVNTGNYTDIQASELITYSSNNGTTYSAYADVTYALRNANLAIGEHTFTVANLTTNEGRENSPGCFGGWSLLVIYAENAEGHLRNISSYHGFVSMGSHPDPILISGFKLPLTGNVDSQATIFSGEGEYRYGKRSGNENDYDWMKISKFEDTGYIYMPGPTNGTHIGNRDNMFDAKLTNIDRDTIAGHSNNLQTNNVGVDIDVFDVSDVMKTYRDIDDDINEVYLKVDSNDDYVTPSMITFSTELYRPNVCYDFAADRNGFALPSESQDINTSANLGDEIGLIIAITSLESDFDLENSAVGVRLDQVDGHLALDQSRAFYSPVNSNVLLNTAFTTISTPNRPEIAIGKNRNEVIGGLIQAYEQYFSKFYFDVTDTNASRVFTDFTVELTTSIDFGSGPVTQVLPVSRCEQSLTYNPKWAAFNVERHAVANPTISNNTDRYSLYTQIAGQDFDYSVVSYDPTANFAVEMDMSGITVDVELINADTFDDNGSSLKCANPSSDIIHGGFGNSKFVTFNNQSRVPITDTLDFSNTDASRSNVFRTWILVDENDTIIPHTASRTDGNVFGGIYDEHYASIDISDRCRNQCTVAATVGDVSCYNCLRQNFARAICSRDNFSIRPAGYRVTLSDAGPDGDENTPSVIVQNSTGTTPAKIGTLAAEYPYLLSGFATDINDVLVNGYTRISSQFTSETYPAGSAELSDNTLDMALMSFQDDTTLCNDTDNNTYDIQFDEGTIVDYNLSGFNAGRYDFVIQDNGWTIVDQAENNPYKTLFDASCSESSLAECNDCGIGSGSISTNQDDKYGCSTLSDLDTPTYEELQLTFNPYKFDLSGLNFVRRPIGGTTDDILYFSDLDSSLLMSIGFSGTLAAQGFLNTNLSNFVTGCAAQDIILDTNKTTFPTDVMDSNDVNISFQQVLVDTVGTTSPAILDNNPLTVDALNFTQVDNGVTVNLDIHYNYQKPLATPMNPSDVNITLLTASSPNASSNANMETSFIPDGNTTGAQRRFYYTKTVPGQVVYKTKENFILTELLVQIYCFDAVNVLCATMGLDTIAYPKVANDLMWYSADVHDPGDGGITNIQVVSGAGNLNPNGALNFIAGKRTDLRVNYSGGGRPEINDINATLSPWLHHITNTTSYRVIFTSQGNWTGIGSTGNVMNTLPKDEQNNRISW